MILELSYFLAILAFFVCILQVAFCYLGNKYQEIKLINVGYYASYTQFFLILFSFLGLMLLFVNVDLTSSLVANNVNTEMPLIYKISGLWANHEGSMMLWLLFLSLYGLLPTMNKNIPTLLKSRIVMIQGGLVLLFLSYILTVSSPFDHTNPVPVTGRGINPILEDIGLAFHPPFLYLGYVGFSTVFSFSAATMLHKNNANIWARLIRPWVLLAWIFLTIGIGLGSWWAYYELGWGGYWYWDPVENVSLMPWLASTALLHSILVLIKRNELSLWAIFLSILTFSLSLIGTFVVRSGVLTSVHSFASDPGRGLFILVILIICIGGAFTLFARQSSHFVKVQPVRMFSREGQMAMGNYFIMTILFIVVVGTFYPLFVEIWSNQEKITVGAPFFNSIIAPLTVPLVALMAVATNSPWKRDVKFSDIKDVVLYCGLLSLAVAVISFVTLDLNVKAMLYIFTSLFLLFAMLFRDVKAKTLFSPAKIGKKSMSYWGMMSSHIGMALLLFSLVGAGMYKHEQVKVLGIGESTSVSGYKFTLKEMGDASTDEYQAQKAVFVVEHNGKNSILEPEKRTYNNFGMPIAVSSVQDNLFETVYVAIGQKSDDIKYVYRIYVHPMIIWLWTSVLLMVFGAILCLLCPLYRLRLSDIKQ